MRQLTQEGMPRIGRGLYPLKACVQWSINYWKDRALGREGDAEKQRGRALQNSILEAKMQEATGHLIPRVEVMQVWSAGFLRLGKMMDGLAPNIGRELNLSTDTVRALRKGLDEARANFVRDCAEYVEMAPVDAPKKRA